MLSVRPRIAELVFQLYGRSLHPELFEIHRTRQIERGGYIATVQITNAGHVVTWQYDGMTLTEVAASAQHPLPQRRRLMSHRLKGTCKRRARMPRRRDVPRGILAGAGRKGNLLDLSERAHRRSDAREGLLHCFESSGRFGLGAMSYVNLESRDRSLKVQAFHTFPDDYAIVKSQSVFSLPDDK